VNIAPVEVEEVVAQRRRGSRLGRGPPPGYYYDAPEDHNARGIASRIGDISPALEAGSFAKAAIYLPRVKASLLIEGFGGEETL